MGVNNGRRGGRRRWELGGEGGSDVSDEYLGVGSDGEWELELVGVGSWEFGRRWE